MNGLERAIMNRSNIEIQTYLYSVLAMFDKIDCYCYESKRLKEARDLVKEEIDQLENTIQDNL